MNKSLLLVLFLLPGSLLFFVTDSPADEGAALYSQHCSVCHGDDGDGGMGVPLSLPSFQKSVSDAYLRKTIQLGRPGRMMPPFDNLTSAELDALVAYLRHWTDEEVPVYDNRRIKADTENGKRLFAANCAACHGPEGQGGRGTGVTLSRPRDLPIIAPALNNSGFLASAEDEMILQVMEQGRASTPMPAFQGVLSESELGDIVSYIRSFDGEASESLALEASPVISIESPYDMDTTVANLREAIVGQNMRLLGVLSVDSGLVEKGQEDPNRVMVNTCRFSRLYDALKIEPRFGILLPCKISVVREEDQVMLYAADPRWFSSIFDNVAIDAVLDDIHSTYLAIMEEATF